MLANPFNWRVRWPRPARVPLFSLGLKMPQSPCGHSGTPGGWLTRYRPREVRNSIYRYRKIHIDYRSKFLYRFISSISIIYGNTTSHPINGLYHNVSPCHFSDRIHFSLIIYSQIYFWSGDSLPGPPFCDGSDLDSYTVMLCSPVGRLPHHCVCLIGNEVEGSDWKKKMRVVALRPWNSQHLVWLMQSCSRDQAGNQNVRQMFFNGRKIDNFCKFLCFSLLLWASVCLNRMQNIYAFQR